MSISTERSQAWVWWVCTLLLLASTINYMDRQTLSSTSDHIKRDFKLTNEAYGTLETAFAFAFATGATVFGLIVDRTSVRFLYPAVLLLWSAMGFATGLVESYAGLLWCRLLLGLFEAGHWPCALKTTQRLLPSSKRTLGNSVLQSGTAIGAMVTPLIIKSLVTDLPGSWRPAFQIIAAVGSVWVVFWSITMWNERIDAPIADQPKTSNGSDAENAIQKSQSFFSVVLSRKYLTLIIVVIAINFCWHQFRVWMKLFLLSDRLKYSEPVSLDLIFWFNVMTDIGCISAGVGTSFLHRAGLSAHWSRLVVFTCCAVLVSCGALIPWLPPGPGMIVALMTVGLGAMGLFPCYYAFAQELSVAHQGKVSGTLGTIAWIVPAVWHPWFGRWVDQTKSYDMGMFLASLMPLAGVIALLVLWPKDHSPEQPAATS